MKVVEERWKEYMNKCISGGASQVQISETRKAFFFGALAYHTALCRCSETEAEQTVKRIHEELMGFLKEP